MFHNNMLHRSPPTYESLPASRRGFLSQSAMGIGAIALASLLDARGLPPALGQGASPDEERWNTRPARARRVIWLYMDGGMSHLDTFDPKPRLKTDHGKPFPLPMEATQFDSNGPILASPWNFSQHGQSGLWISELFPQIAKHADELAVIRSMTSESAVHANANYWMHTGWGMMGRPSIGSWINYGLGSESQELPGYVVLNGGLLATGGSDNYKPGFLPARFSPSMIESRDPPIANIRPSAPDRQSRRLKWIAENDRAFSDRLGHPDPIEAAIRSYELAAKLQVAVPELLDLSDEDELTLRAYGMQADYEHTRTYARQCLLARRMVERGVRFVCLTMPRVHNDTRWDAHGGLMSNHTDHAKTVDQPIAALLGDLKQRGLMQDTLVVFTTEFGRTPFSQGADGRDHNQYGFSVWLAGAGIRGGTVYGQTDEFGYKSIENKCLVHDLHATILDLMGVDHKRLTYPFGGRDYRLTDVHGRVVTEIFA